MKNWKDSNKELLSFVKENTTIPTASWDEAVNNLVLLTYANKPEEKPNGKIRQTYTVNPKLKKIQTKIVKEFFYAVDFPNYLQGSIKDPSSPRDCVRNAMLHAGMRLS